MAGRLALGAEIFLGLDEARAEDLSPVAVDRHPSRERVLRIDQPSRQPQPVRRRPADKGEAPAAPPA